MSAPVFKICAGVYFHIESGATLERSNESWIIIPAGDFRPVDFADTLRDAIVAADHLHPEPEAVAGATSQWLTALHRVGRSADAGNLERRAVRAARLRATA